jgi:hypothetical protein
MLFCSTRPRFGRSSCEYYRSLKENLSSETECKLHEKQGYGRAAEEAHQRPHQRQAADQMEDDSASETPHLVEKYVGQTMSHR